MKWNPFIHAVAAITYISILVSGMRFIESRRHDTSDTLIDGIGVISLLVCSAAIMAFLFFYHPVALLIEGKKTDAAYFFLKTLGIFVVITMLVLTRVV
jgi:hypothetical protein